MLELKNVSKTYSRGNEKVFALKNISLCIEKGELVGIVGPSGSGKSTLMNILGCLDVPTSGEFLFNGRPVTPKNYASFRRNIGFVFQSFNLIPHFSALKNVELPLILAGVRPKLRRELAMSALENVGLSSRAFHLPSELSGGQAQRVAVARALVKMPDIILADEPCGNLDRASADYIMSLFEKLSSSGRTVAIVTHDTAAAERLPRIIKIENGENIYGTT